MTAMEATVKNEYGIHCRPSAVIAKEAQSYAGAIEVVSKSNGAKADAKSILLLVGLGVKCNETVVITVSGPDEEAMARHMVELFETSFDFSRDA